MPDGATLTRQSTKLSLQSELSRALLETLAYSDIFDFPLTTDEIQRYLIAETASPGELAAALAGLSAYVENEGELYALPGRQQLFALRHRRAQHAARLWPQALRFGRLIAALPFVRMVAVTGALASDNVEPGADLDYLVVTAPGWLWLCRAMVLAVNRVAGWHGLKAELCPNYVITTNHLALPDVDLFTAQELCRMIPVSGLPVYFAMRAANSWSSTFLPNAAGAPRPISGAERGVGPLKSALEFVLRVLPFGWLERWEMRRKIAKFSAQTTNAETRFSADYCKGHFDGHKQQTLDAHAARVRELAFRQP